MRLTRLVPIVLLLAWGASTAALATIVTTGDVDPVHTGADPWVIAAELWIGNSGMGELTVSDGGSVENTFGRIGRLAGSDGTATVTGGGSTWTNSQALNVGDAGMGTLMIEGGGSVSSASGRIGNDSDSAGDVEITGGGSTWTNNGGLVVGFAGTGNLTVSAGGSVSNVDGTIGLDVDSTGTATVTGDDSSWTNNSSLTIGQLGTGTLTIEAGGRVENTAGTLGFNEGSTGTVTVTGADATWTNSTFLNVGNFGMGELTIENGGSVSSNMGRIGVNAGATGTVTVTGADSTWTNSGELFLNRGGSLTIEAGGSVENTSGTIGTATVTVSGTGSTWTNTGELRVGQGIEGMLTIADGGRVESTAGTIGIGSGTTDTVNVTGAGSTWTMSDNLRVGTSSGNGTLTIENGGSVSNTNGILGESGGGVSNAVGHVVVCGNGSAWSNSGSISLAFGSTLTIENGGSVESTGGSIGIGAGIVTVSGTGSTWTNHGVLGLFAGTLAIDSGGTVSNTNGSIGLGFMSMGTVTVAGDDSRWMMSARLAIGGDATMGTDGGTGTLDVSPGGTVDVAEETILYPDGLLRLQGGTLATTEFDFQGGQFQWTAGTLHVERFDGDLTNPTGGTLAPGRSAGGTTIFGNYTQEAGATLEIEIGGLSPVGQYDQVQVLGDVLLGGELRLDLIDGFVPTAGSTFTILGATGNLAGVFTNIFSGLRLETVDGLGSFRVDYGLGNPTPNQIVLSDFQLANPGGLPGDYNQNGVVDAADYTVWRDRLGQVASLPNDDTAGVDFDDYDRWKANFGMPFGGGTDVGSISAVPEPATLIMLLTGIATMFKFCRTSVSRLTNP